ncbi:hypothetical protein DICSQDRAFT_153370 [Dichomitus squalens LYAD-421 SS1]|uniref:Uncharacterized protein n=1 Tax=Dichomitus squalens TaxID=114155 RepID=A0A4Q9PY08_9APHY|nr:uncharacterized protein DICSQDRAFT_153370 [Dichomitus squalens LYAD-421 SS1]EJF64303.1 hypothetical protein DICSQDRAFT_153370 [Dichomitus squalens LYAD-421 SS1]TBU59489.1 hypothetical protein BD310DRAFT_817167 [Dichomitus squalens]
MQPLSRRKCYVHLHKRLGDWRGGTMMCSVILRAVVGSCPSAHARPEATQSSRRAESVQKKPRAAASATQTISGSGRQGASK